MSYNRIEADAIRAIVGRWIEKSDSCVELGGGAGRITQSIERDFANTLVIDMSGAGLLSATRVLSKASLVRADIAHIPARSSSFDYVLMIDVIHLVPDSASVFSEIVRVSKKHGQLIISIPNMQINFILRQLYKISPRLRSIFPTFGPALWSLGTRPYFKPDRLLMPDSFKLKDRRGTGWFNNYLGKTLQRLNFLYLADVATSPLWILKLNLICRFEVVKDQ